MSEMKTARHAGRGTILVVEDDPGVLRLQRQHLERAGYAVVTAEEAEEALRAVEQHPIDLIVLDYKLSSHYTGLDFYERLKATGSTVPVIIVTGFSDESTVIKALRAGVREFVTKSVEYLDYLPEATERVLAQVRTERQLAESEARFAAIIRSAKDAIIIAESDRRVRLFNPAAEQMFRCPSTRAIGRSLTQFIPRELAATAAVNGDSAELAESITNLVRWGSRGVRDRGEEFPLEASVSRVDVGGRKLYAVIVRDVSERVRSEARLREQAALLDQARDAIIACDAEDRILFWNRGAERLYGWTAAEAVGRIKTDLLYRGRPPELEGACQWEMEQGEWAGELTQVTKNGKAIVVESRRTLVRDEHGRPKSKLVINTDITEKKKLEAQYLRAQRMESLGALAGGLAHDLNNVMTPIVMALDLLKLPMADRDRLSMLATLEVSAHRGVDMVRQVLSFARGVEGERIPLPFKSIVKEIEHMLRHTLPKSISVESTIPPDLWLVSGDATQLGQVLMNLSVNARDAMPNGGRLSFCAENVLVDEGGAASHPTGKPGRYVVVAVTDTGTGIPAGVRDQIFDPFFTTKQTGQGTGLGLSTVLGIVKSHGGAVAVDSEVGAGTRFSVYLPAAAQVRPAQPDRLPEAPPGNGETILLVDDEAAVRVITKATLEAHGYQVLTASDGSEAMAVYERHRGDIRLVIVDSMMPVMDGAATIRALRQLDPYVVVIAVSGLSDATDPTELDARAVLAKPYTAEKLLRTLSELLFGPS
jgi:two-component system cell cycle sensor histidine kinase/response regulator CckA